MDLTASGFRPPCWPADQACPNQCAEQVRDQITRNHVAPTGLGLATDAEIRLAHTRARNAAKKHAGEVTVIRLPVRDWHAERYGTRAG